MTDDNQSWETRVPVLSNTWWQRIGAFIADFHNRTVLFRAGRFIFVTYGILTAIGFSVGTLVALTQYQKSGGQPEQFVQFTVFVLFPMVIGGARLFSIFLEWRGLLKAPIEILLKPGFMLHGGIFGGAVAIAMATHLWGMSPLRLMDAWALGLPIGESITRIGCYVYGCCWGKETHSHFSVCYTSFDAKVLRVHPHLANRKIYPAQIIGTVLYGGLFLVTLVVAQGLPVPGVIAATYLMLHPLLRLLHERFREDERGSAFGGLTHTNVYAGIQFAFGTVLGGAVIYSQPVLPPHVPMSALQSLPVAEQIIFIGAIAVGAAVVFGVHIDKVGQWIPQNRPYESMAGAVFRKAHNSLTAPLSLTSGQPFNGGAVPIGNGGGEGGNAHVSKQSTQYF